MSTFINNFKIMKFPLVLLFIYILIGCGGGSSGGNSSGKNILIQGSLPIVNTAPKASIKNEDGDNLRASPVNHTSTLKVVVLPAQKELLQDDDVTTISSPDLSGDFSMDINTIEEDYVILVYDESLGDGIDQLVGFIELTVDENESSASWELSLAEDGAMLDLGEV
jgi:hypothetical protein